MDVTSQICVQRLHSFSDLKSLIFEFCIFFFVEFDMFDEVCYPEQATN